MKQKKGTPLKRGSKPAAVKTLKNTSVLGAVTTLKDIAPLKKPF